MFGGGGTLPCDLSHEACDVPTTSLDRMTEIITFLQLRLRPVKTPVFMYSVFTLRGGGGAGVSTVVLLAGPTHAATHSSSVSKLLSFPPQSA